MVLRLIFTILLITLIAVFSGFNLDNRCSVWLFAKTFENVPVFLSVLISFAAGILVTLPAVFFKRGKRLTPEQARAQAERLEAREKKQLENQIKRQKKLEEAKAKAQLAFSKKNQAKSDAENSAEQNQEEKK